MEKTRKVNWHTEICDSKKCQLLCARLHLGSRVPCRITQTIVHEKLNGHSQSVKMIVLPSHCSGKHDRVLIKKMGILLSTKGAGNTSKGM